MSKQCTPLVRKCFLYLSISGRNIFSQSNCNSTIFHGFCFITLMAKRALDAARKINDMLNQYQSTD